LRYKDVYIIWTVYFNSKLSKREGRRVSLNEAIPNPTLEEVINACNRLGLEITGYERKRYPRIWWMENAYVVVKKGDIKKSEIVKLIAKEIRRLRGGR